MEYDLFSDFDYSIIKSEDEIKKKRILLSCFLDINTKSRHISILSSIIKYESRFKSPIIFRSK